MYCAAAAAEVLVALVGENKLAAARIGVVAVDGWPRYGGGEGDPGMLVEGALGECMGELAPEAGVVAAVVVVVWIVDDEDDDGALVVILVKGGSLPWKPLRGRLRFLTGCAVDDASPSMDIGIETDIGSSNGDGIDECEGEVALEYSDPILSGSDVGMGM